jgi:hypothetical protein
LVVSTKSDIGAVVITDLHRLVFAQRNRHVNRDAGARLAPYWIRDASHAGNAAEPQISVQRAPEPWLHIVTQVAFKRSERLFGLPLRNRGLIRLWIVRIEPTPA